MEIQVIHVICKQKNVLSSNGWHFAAQTLPKIEQLPSLLQYPSDRTKQFAYLNKPFNFQAETFVK